jgi:methylmalonyl-CoA mutase N-terminal domain/subunit
LIEAIDRAGGTLAAIEQGRIQRQVQDAAYSAQQAIDRGEAVIVGVNKFTTDEAQSIELLQIDPESERRQADAVRTLRGRRDRAACQAALDAIVAAARGSANLVPPIITAVEARATLGEIADAMRGVFGEHREIHT